jgi:hypothetical protein
LAINHLQRHQAMLIEGLNNCLQPAVIAAERFWLLPGR